MPIYATAFKKDVKRLKKQSKDIEKLKKIMLQLCEEKILNRSNFDHALKGNFKGYRECHIEPDWLLIYKLNKPSIYFARTGSHAQLFKI